MRLGESFGDNFVFEKYRIFRYELRYLPRRQVSEIYSLDKTEALLELKKKLVDEIW